MRKTFLLLTFLPAISFAGNIGLDARFDHVSNTPNDAAIAASKNTYSSFQLSRLKIDFAGKLSDSISFRSRIDPLQIDATKNKRDSASLFIDFAYISHKLNDTWSLAMGKIISGMGGVEGNNNPADYYLKSEALVETSAIYWPTGAQLESNFGDNKVKFNLFNVTEDVNGAASNNASTRNAYGFTYTSKFMDGNLLPNISYHTESYGKNGVAKTNSYAAAGLKYLISDYEIEADYLLNSYKPDPQASSDKISTASTVALVRYKMNDLGSLHLKYEVSERKTATGASTDTKTAVNGLTLAFEYKPIKDENWRAHFAITQKDTTPNTGVASADKTQTEQTVYVGMRVLADFVKN